MEEGRIHKRFPRLLRGTLERDTGEKLEILIKNISLHGLGGKLVHGHVLKGERVVVVLPKIGQCHGIVQWVLNSAIGVKIDDEIDADMLIFHNSSLPAPKEEPFSVAPRFKPETNTHRPGFGRK